MPFAQGAHHARTGKHRQRKKRKEREEEGRNSSSVENNQSMRPSNNPEPKEKRTSLKKCLASGERSVERERGRMQDTQHGSGKQDEKLNGKLEL